jgi:hypothetical protein
VTALVVVLAELGHPIAYVLGAPVLAAFALNVLRYLAALWGPQPR